jgi:hypothetical protein
MTDAHAFIVALDFTVALARAAKCWQEIKL